MRQNFSAFFFLSHMYTRNSICIGTLACWLLFFSRAVAVTAKNLIKWQMIIFFVFIRRKAGQCPYQSRSKNWTFHSCNLILLVVRDDDKLSQKKKNSANLSSLKLHIIKYKKNYSHCIYLFCCIIKTRIK